MKILKSKRLYLAAALLALPATLNALSDYYLKIENYGSIGSSNNSNNTGSGWANLAVGWNHLFSNSSSYSAAIGTNLQVNNNASLVVGKNNALTATPAHFIVGKGASPSDPSNALEVLANGTVNIPGIANIGKVPARGGISMGRYTAP